METSRAIVKSYIEGTNKEKINLNSKLGNLEFFLNKLKRSGLKMPKKKK